MWAPSGTVLYQLTQCCMGDACAGLHRRILGARVRVADLVGEFYEPPDVGDRQHTCHSGLLFFFAFFFFFLGALALGAEGS